MPTTKNNVRNATFRVPAYIILLMTLVTFYCFTINASPSLPAGSYQSGALTLNVNNDSTYSLSGVTGDTLLTSTGRWEFHDNDTLFLFNLSNTKRYQEQMIASCQIIPIEVTYICATFVEPDTLLILSSLSPGLKFNLSNTIFFRQKEIDDFALIYLVNQGHDFMSDLTCRNLIYGTMRKANKNDNVLQLKNLQTDSAATGLWPLMTESNGRKYICGLIAIDKGAVRPTFINDDIWIQIFENADCTDRIYKADISRRQSVMFRELFLGETRIRVFGYSNALSELTELLNKPE